MLFRVKYLKQVQYFLYLKSYTHSTKKHGNTKVIAAVYETSALAQLYWLNNTIGLHHQIHVVIVLRVHFNTSHTDDPAEMSYVKVVRTA